MADRPPEVCAFCGEGDESGNLKNTTDDDILAHNNCLLYSPGVFHRPMKDSQDFTTEFDIESVNTEIRRGKKMKCSYCGKKGATIGCDVKKCKKTYHYLCVRKDEGVYIKDEDKEIYIIHCQKHANEQNQRKNSQLGNQTPTSSKGSNRLSRSHGSTMLKKRKRKPLSALRKRRWLEQKFDHGVVQNEEEENMSDMEDLEPSTPGTHQQCRESGSDSESDAEYLDGPPASSEILNPVSCGISEIDTSNGEFKKSLHPTSYESSSSSSSDSWSLLDPKISRTVSLSGFPKRNKKRTIKRDNPELEAALPTMPPDEKKAYSLLYDELGGSVSMSQEFLTSHNDCNDNQTETDIEDDEIDVLESTVLITTPDTQSANSTLKTSTSNLESPSAESKGAPFGQPDATNKETSKNNFSDTTNTDKQGYILQLEDHSYCSNGQIITSSQPDVFSDGKDTCSPISQPLDKSYFSVNTQPVDSSNSEERVAAQPVSLDYDKIRMAKELFVIFNKFINENKCIILGRNASANASKPLHEDPVNFYSRTKPSDKEHLNNNVKVSEMSCKQPVLSTSAAGSMEGHAIKRRPVARTLDFSTHMPSINKSLDQQPTSTNKTLNEQPTQSNEHTDSLIKSKTSDDQPKHPTLTTKPKDLSVEQTAQEHKSKAQSSLSKFSEKGFCSPREENTTAGKGTLRPLLTFNLEARPATPRSPDVTSAKASLHEIEPPHSSYLSPQQLKEISSQLRNGSFSKTFNSMVPQIKSTIESAMKTQPQNGHDDIKSKETLEPNISLQLTEKHSTNPDGHLGNSDDGNFEEPPELNISSKHSTKHSNNLEANQTNRGFPTNMELSLNNEQKSLLLESYRRIKKQMKTSDVIEAGAARVFWNLCLESKCREFLLTMLFDCAESVINKIIHEEPEDRDYEQAFAFLQASGCFEDFLKAEDSQTRMSSSNKEPLNQKSSLASGSSILSSHAELEGRETVCNKELDMMELELPNTSLSSMRGNEESTREEDNDIRETGLPETSLPSSSASSTMNETLSQTGGNCVISEVQLAVKKMLHDLNAHRLHLQDDDDGDAAFARSLVPFLNKVPEDKKLHTRIALQNVLLSALSQNLQ